MKKIFKIFAIAAIAVAAAIACVFAGCDNGGDGKTSSDYNFTIVYVGGDKDGKPVNGQTDGGRDDGKVSTQICLPATAGGTCVDLTMANKYPTANGKLSLSQKEVNGLFGSDTDVTQFIFHAIGVAGYKHDCEIEVNGKGNYELKIIVG